MWGVAPSERDWDRTSDPSLVRYDLASETIAGLGIRLSPGRSQVARGRIALWSDMVVTLNEHRLGHDQLPGGSALAQEDNWPTL